MTDKIAYEPHPVSPERKAELRKQGYKIIDEVFKPADESEGGELSAKELIALIAESTDKEKLTEYAADKRKTVKDAAEKRLSELQ